MVSLIFRKKLSGAHSIEELFTNIYCMLNNRIACQILSAPSYSNTIIGIISNILYFRKNQTIVNHITGDIHYVIPFLNKKNKNILTIHDCALLHSISKNSLKYWIYKWVWFDFPVRYASHVTTISEKSKDDIIRFTKCDPTKIKVIPNGLNQIFTYKEKKKTSTENIILQIGTASNKNLSTVIKSLKGIDCTLYIIGDLSPQDLADLNLYKIKYKKFIDLSTEEILVKYQESDLVIFISTFEGFGMPIIEANATGSPVITSNLPPMIEVASGSAHLIDPYDIDSIHHAVSYILNNKPYRNELVEKGLKNAKKYSIESISKEYLRLYDQKT